MGRWVVGSPRMSSVWWSLPCPHSRRCSVPVDGWVGGWVDELISKRRRMSHLTNLTTNQPTNQPTNHPPTHLPNTRKPLPASGASARRRTRRERSVNQ